MLTTTTLLSLFLLTADSTTRLLLIIIIKPMVGMSKSSRNRGGTGAQAFVTGHIFKLLILSVIGLGVCMYFFILGAKVCIYTFMIYLPYFVDALSL
jgi:hypothetical protein